MTAPKRTPWKPGKRAGLNRKLVDPLRVRVNAEGMTDALKDRVYEERIKILQARLDKAIEQRDRFAKNFHGLSRVPYQEQREIIEDCNADIEQAGKHSDARPHD